MIDEESTFNPFTPGAVKPVKKVVSKRRHEGYLMLDNRVSPGLSDKDVHLARLPPGAGRGLFEAPTYSCSHCQRVVVINPDRSRDRAYCRRCDHYICDECGVKLALTKECKTFNQLADEVLNSMAHGKPIEIDVPGTLDQTTIIIP